MHRRFSVLLLVFFVTAAAEASAFSVTAAGATAPSSSSTLLSLSRGGGAATAARISPKKPNASARKSAASADDSSDSSMAYGQGTATIPNEVFNLVKSIVGSGVLSLPYGVAAFGNAPSALIPAVALIAVMGGLSAYTFGLIGRVCESTKSDSYSQAWDRSVKSGSWLIALSCFTDCFAGNLSYSMILADTFQRLAVTAGFAALTRTQALLGVTGVVLLPLCLLKNLNSLAPFSLVGIAGMLYTTLAMGVRYFGQSYAPGGAFFVPGATAPAFGDVGAAGALDPKVLILTCMLSNAYIAHFNAGRFLAELKNPTMKRFNQVIAWSFGTAIALYGIITSFGFLTFGSAADGLVLNNYSTADKLMSLSRIAVAISITFSYPLIFVGSRDGILDLFNVKNRNNNVLNGLTVGLMAIVTVLASKLTDLGIVAAIGGATFGTALVFVYPVIMFLKSKVRTKEETPVAVGIGALGVLMGIVGTYLSVSGVGVE
jgi:amino acid permease